MCRSELENCSCPIDLLQETVCVSVPEYGDLSKVSEVSCSVKIDKDEDKQ